VLHEKRRTERKNGGRDDLTSLLRATAIDAATSTGKLLRTGFGRPQQVDHSLEHDLKLALDRACEEKVLGVLRRNFPGHAVLSEEMGYAPGRDPYVWIVDPLDGTVNYYHGLPHFCTSIACHAVQDAGAENPGPALPDGRRVGAACVGAIFDPLREEVFVGTAGGRATLNGEPLALPPQVDLSQAVVVVSFGVRDESLAFMSRIVPLLSVQAQKVRSLGSTALDMAYVAAGRIGAFIQHGTNLWDFTAAAVVVRAAGGTVDAREIVPGRYRVIACNPGLHERLSRLVES